MSQLRIDEVLPSKSGKAWRVRSGSNWYNAFGDSGIEVHTGKLIEAEITTHEKYGMGIGKYKVVAPGVPTQAPEVSKKPFETVTTVPWYLPFCSNTVAHAISAGLIKEPTDIKVWFLAARRAVEGD